jgi:hypothetical protein
MNSSKHSSRPRNTALAAALAVVCALLTLPAAAGALTLTQPTGSPYAVGNFPQKVASGDLNDDGAPDLVNANLADHNVSVMLGNGHGRYVPAPGSPFDVGEVPYGVAIGEFDGDGKADIVVASSGYGDVTVLLGDGAGAFAESSASPIHVGDFPQTVSVADIDEDGVQDLALPTYSGIAILLGDGSGGFALTSGSPYPAGGAPFDVAVADFDGDGHLDVASADSNSDQVTVLLGDGTGDFAAAPNSPHPTGHVPGAIEAGDFNEDDVPDLAVADYFQGAFTILLGVGDGDFTEAPGSPIRVGQEPYDVALADFNADGLLDVAAPDYGADTAVVLLGDGTGRFAEAPGTPVPTGGEHPVAIVADDLNLDGSPDLAITNSTNPGSVSVLLNGSRPAIALDHSGLDFGASRIGTVSTAETITVTNPGDAPLQIQGVRSTGPDAEDFVVSSDRCSGERLLASSTGQSCIVRVRFAPSALGAHSATLKIASNAASGASSLALSGSGAQEPVDPAPTTSESPASSNSGAAPLMPTIDVLRIRGRRATPRFHTSEPATFQCSLDGAAYRLCRTGHRYVNLARGTHTLEVRAIDPISGTESAPATRTFVIGRVSD